MRREFNLSAFFVALDSRRAVSGLSWKELGAELEIKPETFSRMLAGVTPSLGDLLTIAGYLDLRLDDFAQAPGPSEEERRKQVEVLQRYLRQDGVDDLELASQLASSTR